MTKFEKIFGMDPFEVKKNCVLVPLVNKDVLSAFGITDLKRGKVYGCAQGAGFTFIHTGMNAGILGDAVLYLKDTACKNLFLFGSCGSTGILDLGDVVVLREVYAHESFSAMLSGKDEKRTFYPTSSLCEKLARRGELKTVVCATLASLKLEEERVDLLASADVVDMECSAFFAGVVSAGLNGAALFYVSDVIKKKPFYEPMNDRDHQALEEAIKKGARILLKFLQEF
jgi:purine-nucleoside phosphorylase